MRLVIAGGGTGGHVSPGLAVVAALRRQGPVDVLWLGTRDGVERQIVASAGLPFYEIQAGKLRRYLSFSTITDAPRVPVGVMQAYSALRRFKPEVVLSTGGFVSVPTVLAAALRRIPVLIHEQTAQFGLANRINARFATVVALSFDVSRAHLPPTGKRVVVTGNPVREDLRYGDPVTAAERFGLDRDLPTIYVTGGARGSHRLNLTIAELLPGLLERRQVIHATGPVEANADYATLRARASAWPERLSRRYIVRHFVGAELPHVYALASIVVARAGAGTVAELASLGKPAILVPLPGTGGDEQTKNAALLEGAGGAVVLPEAGFTPALLLSELERLLSDAAGLQRMSAAAVSLARPDAADALAGELLRLVAKHG